jgi:molecular chaperone Hsp33
VCGASDGGEAAAASGDTLVRTIAVNGECVVCVGVSTRLVTDGMLRHGTAPTASAALGRCLTGTLLMAAFRGEGEQLQVTFKGSGPLGTSARPSTSLQQCNSCES